jgi:large subunit ribosomal protein L3
MEKILLGRKIGMTQHWDESGRLIAGTVIFAEPNTVINQGDRTMVAIATAGKTNKAQSHLKELVGSKRGILVKEASTKLTADQKEVDVTVFEVGDEVKITGTTKGKGFAGTIKRHNFHRGPAGHGSNNVRQPGSIGAQQPQRVVKGKKMSGRMGGANLTVRGNKVVLVDKDKNLIIVSGNIPGPARAYVTIQNT